jgi:hypothetical protein
VSLMFNAVCSCCDRFCALFCVPSSQHGARREEAFSKGVIECMNEE